LAKKEILSFKINLFAPRGSLLNSNFKSSQERGYPDQRLSKGRMEMSSLIRMINLTVERSGWILMWFPWAVTGIIVWEIILRYFLGLPTIWAHELSLMIFGAVSMLGGAYAHKYRAHVNMDLFYSRLSRRGRLILDIITFPFFLSFCGILLWKGWDFAWRSVLTWEYSQSNWAPLIWPIKLIIPLGALLILLQGISNLLSDIREFFSGKGEEK
jgi:TRAP-type mannitol/chloroaromatic compound transport system permease small subunit